MNYAIIFYTLGVVIDFSAAFMLPPFIVALLYRENDAKYFLLNLQTKSSMPVKDM